MVRSVIAVCAVLMSCMWCGVLHSGETGRLQIPDTKYGQHIIPDEKVLRNWKVYSTPIIFDRKSLAGASFKAVSPEAVVVNFFGEIVKKTDTYKTFFSPRMRPEVRTSVVRMQAMKGESFSKLRIFAKLRTDVAMTIEKTKGSFLANREDMARVIRHYGPFDVIIFFETPPLTEDGFVLLSREQDEWKILAVTGWLYTPGK